MTPVICLIFTFLIKELASEQLPKGDIFADSTFPFVFGDSSLADQESLNIDKETGKRIPNSPSRDNPLQWYLYSCVDRCNQSSTLLGQYDGLAPQTSPSGQTLLGSVPNDPSQNPIFNVQIDYYSDKQQTTRYVPFFIPTNNINSDLFDRGEMIA